VFSLTEGLLPDPLIHGQLVWLDRADLVRPPPRRALDLRSSQTLAIANGS